MSGFSETDLDNLEKPVARVRVGKAYKGAPTERAVQRAIIKAGKRLGIWCLHVPNGTSLAGDAFARMKQSAVLKADGMEPGALDLICIRSVRQWGWIEVKKPGGYISEDQANFMKKLDRHGIPNTAVCAVDAAVQAWEDWDWI